MEPFDAIDDDNQSATLEEYSDRLMTYMSLQDTEADREATAPEPPWPDENNEMLAYLMNRAIEMATKAEMAELPTTEWMRRVTCWLAPHAWYEGGLAERARSRNQA
jgi:hypothetical protein